MASTQPDVKEYSCFVDNQWRKAGDNRLHDEFLGRFVARTKTLPAGDPLVPKTIIGPLITRDAVKLIDDRVKEAVSRGAKVHTGGKHDGNIYYPTILTDVPRDAAIANDETFG